MIEVIQSAHQPIPTTASPLVSVIMPAFNVEEYIGEAIESILSQTFDDFELIIINDGSSDATQGIIEHYARQDERIIHRSITYNSGVYHARQLGLTQARGTFIAMMDADDISLPERFEKQVRFLESHPEVGIVGGAMLIVDKENAPIGYRRYWTDDSSIRKHLFRYSPFCGASIMVRKTLLDTVGDYAANRDVAEDYDLFLRLGMFTTFANLPEVIYRYRVRPHSLSHRMMRAQELLTIRTQLKYFSIYRATILDRMVCLIHLFFLFMLPSRWKYWIFLKIREKIV